MHALAVMAVAVAGSILSVAFERYCDWLDRHR